ncbi:hypothetical protein Syun_030582 [Stephania yunnanensis]|uniref:Uncharacterized protein n=1 Tax=Stephania yunnanensis TaxID=152371 RepID=A0AAP0E1Q7_9MAGN
MQQRRLRVKIQNEPSLRRANNKVAENTKMDFIQDGGPAFYEEPEDDSCFDEENEVEDEEHPVNFDKPPKFDFDNQDFIEDTVVFRDEGLFVKIIPWSTSSPQRETVANDAFVKKCSSEINARNEVKFATKHFCSLNKAVDSENFGEFRIKLFRLMDLASKGDKFILLSALK